MPTNGEKPDHSMGGTEDVLGKDVLGKFSVIKIDDADVRPDAWVIYKDAAKPVGMTRAQWLKINGLGPTEDQFATRSYTIHASFTGNDDLKVNGQFGDHDHMPPQVFVNHIKLSDSEQKIVDAISDKDEKGKKAYYYKAERFRKIATKIGVPKNIPEYQKPLTGKQQVYKTSGGGAQPCTKQYDNQVRAGYNIPNVQVWKGQELLEVAWHTKDGNGKYDGKSLAEAQALANRDYGGGVEIALKATGDTNRTMGTAQLAQYEDGAARRWAAQIGDKRERNQHFSHLAAVVTTDDPARKSSCVDVKWLKDNNPDHPLVEGLLKGQLGHHLLVIPSGHGRTDVWTGMGNFPRETAKLLDDVGIPKTIAECRPGDREMQRKVANTLPAVGRPYGKYMDGPLKEGEDVKAYLPEELMIANCNMNGERTGSQRTLSAYGEQKLRLPDDAAKELNVAPDVFSKSAKTRGYDTRPQGGRAGSSVADF